MPHSWMSWESAAPTRVWSCTRHTHTRDSEADGVCVYVCVSVCVSVYLQVVDQQLVESWVSVEVDQEALVVHQAYPGRLERDPQTLQLLLALLEHTQFQMTLVKWPYGIALTCTFPLEACTQSTITYKVHVVHLGYFVRVCVYVCVCVCVCT